jgi:hypothetical protein
MASGVFLMIIINFRLSQRLEAVRRCLVQVIVARTSVIKPCEEGVHSKAVSNIGKKTFVV